jgi:mRNA interferase HigB
MIREFWEKHPDCEHQFKLWHKEVFDAKWTDPRDVKIKFPGASILQGNRVVFNIKGNKYRLIVRINYHHQIVWIRFVGTHSAYDRINAENI